MPFSTFSKFWDIIYSNAIIINVITIPYNLSFHNSSFYVNPVYFWSNLFVFCLHVVLLTNTSYYECKILNLRIIFIKLEGILIKDRY